MLKQPRKTLCSDSRLTLDTLHNRIMQRLETEEARAEYLLHVMHFFENFDDHTSKKGTNFQNFAALVQPYMTDSEKTKIVVDLVTPENGQAGGCQGCGSFEHTLDLGYRTCSNCGITVPHQTTTRAALNYNDVREEVISYPYRRSNHFQEWLLQSQAKQTTVIPEDVYASIRQEMKKRRITDAQLDVKVLKSLMKALRLNKYYEHVAYILFHMTGRRPLTLSIEVEERMKFMFAQVQEPFDQVIPIVCPQRRNFLSYAYVIRKFAELMELDDIVESFPLLKSREKLIVQDRIWKAITEKLDWRFIPSM